MKKAKWFWKDASGLNADIERHMKEEKKLMDKIAELEAIEQPSEMDIRSLRVYRNFLYRLQDSKAEVVSKIGKK